MKTPLPFTAAGLLPLFLLLALAPASLAQTIELPSHYSLPDFRRSPILRPELLRPTEETSSSSNGPERIRLFRIQPGFLSDPVGLDSDDTAADGKPAEPDG